jgi:hypothetical protein
MSTCPPPRSPSTRHGRPQATARCPHHHAGRDDGDRHAGLTHPEKPAAGPV